MLYLRLNNKRILKLNYMKTFTFAASLAIALTLITSESCSFAIGSTSIKPSKQYATKKVEIKNINSISASTSVDVVYTQSQGKSYAEVYAPNNIIPYVKVQQIGNKLKVSYDFPKGKSLSIQGKYMCEVRVFAPEVIDFSTSSSSDIKFANGLKTHKNVTLSTSSSGDIDATNITCNNLKMNTSSSGDITIGNITCHMLSLSTSSSGDMKINTARCNETDIRSSSSGDCEIKSLSCRGTVKATTSSSGDISLSGKCKNANYSAKSGGSIHAKKLKSVNVTASATSGGDIECYATGRLSTRTGSGGEIRYAGNPTSIEGKPNKISKF